MTCILRALRLVVLFSLCFTAVLMFWKEQFYLVHKAENPHLVLGVGKKSFANRVLYRCRCFGNKENSKDATHSKPCTSNPILLDVADAIKAF